MKLVLTGKIRSSPVDLQSRCKRDLMQTTKEKEKLFHMYLINYEDKIMIPKKKLKYCYYYLDFSF